MDTDTGNRAIVANSTTLGDSVSFIVSDNHLYNMTVVATNIKYSTTSAIRLSKYTYFPTRHIIIGHFMTRYA